MSKINKNEFLYLIKHTCLVVLMFSFVSIHKVYSQNEQGGLARIGFELGLGTTIAGEYFDENDEMVEKKITPFNVHIGFLTKNKKNEFHLVFGKYIGLEYVLNFVGNKPKRVFPFVGIGAGLTSIGYPGQKTKVDKYDDSGAYYEDIDVHFSGYLKPRLGLNIYVSKKTLLQPCLSISQLGQSTRLSLSLPLFFTF